MGGGVSAIETRMARHANSKETVKQYEIRLRRTALAVPEKVMRKTLLAIPPARWSRRMVVTSPWTEGRFAMKPCGCDFGHIKTLCGRPALCCLA